MAAHQWFEGRHVHRVDVERAVDVELGRSCHRGGGRQHGRSVLAERGQRVDTLDGSGRQVVTTVLPDGDRAGGAQGGDETDSRVCDKTRDQRGPAGLELLQQHPLRGRDVDHPQVAAGEHDQLRVVRVRALRLEDLVDATRRRLLCAGSARATQVLQHRVDPAPALDAALDPGRLRLGQGPAQVAELDAVARCERLALRLTVVAEQDQVIRPRCSLRHLLQDGHHLVETSERGQRLDPGPAGVVRDLVVVDVVDVDAAGASHHLLAHDGGVEVAQQAVAEGAQPGEGPRAVHPRMHVEAALPLLPGSAPGRSPPWSGRSSAPCRPAG